MSVLKNLRSIFIVEEDNGTKEPDAKTSAEVPSKGAKAKPSNSQPKSNPRPVSDIPSGKTDDRIVNTLFEAMERANLDGFDYIEFKRSVRGLEKMVTDEATRFKSAFATASTMGVTMDKLVETANHYVTILDRERQQFFSAAAQQTKKLVDNREKELKQMLQTMADKKRMIEQLNKELDESEQKMKAMQDSIEEASSKIEHTKKNFDVSFNYLRELISNDIEKIKTFLK